MLILKFACLNNRDVIEARISDHDPLFVDTPYGRVCYFNMMCQGSGKNNAYKQIENLNEYKARLEKIIHVLKEIQNKYLVAGFMLQESPNLNSRTQEEKDVANYFYTELKNQLTNFQVAPVSFSRKTFNTRSCMFSTFDKTIFPIQTATVYSAKEGREQEIKLTDKKGNSVTAINVHGDHAKQSETASFIIQSAKSGSIVGGDLNITNGTQEALNLVCVLQAIPKANVNLTQARNFKTLDIAVCTLAKK
ncbi:MAG: hypothetical protein P4M12_05905 [Gammaproteobacteria bacterium]|nr:hypothetical protein [Gammaproteobacteria bacterium]